MLVDVGLPLSLAIIMFSLGYGLTFGDFGRVLTMPRAVLTGIVGQVVLIPLVAVGLLQIFDLPPALAFGLLLLSFAPGGVTSSILTKLAGGTVALSITLTAVVSLLSVLTVPFLVAWAASTTLGAAAPPIDVAGIGIAMFAITAVPVLLGLLVRHFAPGFAARTERLVSGIALVLFVLIVIAALAANWTIFATNFPKLGPVLMLMNLILLGLGLGVARLLRLGGGDGMCISIEMGVQNATLGIAVAGLVAQTGGIPDYALPSAVYGITMYLVTVPAVLILRRIFSGA
ncbi:bile acid:sodium symporter family protein [Oceanomicrobium pacificus]|uniref:Bile acid:sodium symporter family protein n=1 Tax=Oceanomicrobium pacificus TaxID=2692916 RepID=A0A6B0TPA0_9RHOB|nr:bile acid:sodium symporter family protein [Oceanomicrobium pacificus]MXU64439.1 bile acid:sodium symporter family protein [Oceanomicrobium pacificus]